ncbi:hypothetical protein ACHAWF_000549, partial [Thalassiosira exigua]
MHLNLITNGKSLFERSDDDDERGEGARNEGEISFRQCITDMVDVLRPHLHDSLLPAVRTMTNSSTVEISDVFIRHYGATGDAECGNEGSAATRNGLSAHYDVIAFATCVIALDSTSSLGRNGLYAAPPTTPAVAGGATCGHAALRRFVPLDKGDGVVHTFDVLHGVDVDPGLKRSRTSLIVWFTDNGDGGEDEDETEECVSKAQCPPWLLHPADDVGAFVAALAAETAAAELDRGVNAPLKATDPYDLYLASASKGNAFALTSLAGMCQEDLIPDEEYDRVYNVAADGTAGSNPFLPTRVDKTNGPRRCKDLARALWYRAAISGGHRVAQVSLADDLMLEYTKNKEDMSCAEREYALSAAAVLFAMARAQG